MISISQHDDISTSNNMPFLILSEHGHFHSLSCTKGVTPKKIALCHERKSSLTRHTAVKPKCSRNSFQNDKTGQRYPTISIVVYLLYMILLFLSIFVVTKKTKLKTDYVKNCEISLVCPIIFTPLSNNRYPRRKRSRRL